MKAIYFEQHGDLDVLQYGDLPEPKGSTIVKVKAVALNHLDIWVTKGWKGLNLVLPHITGSDICGEVVETANTQFKSGDSVIVYPGIGADNLSPDYKIIGEHVPGGLAEYVAVPDENLYPKPDYLSATEAAAINLVGLTCWHMLFTRGALGKDQTITIVGAGGGVNSMAIQIASTLGAKVIALTSSGKEEKTKAIGAAHAINYQTNSDWHKEIFQLTNGRGSDLIIDNVGAATYHKSLKALALGGKLLTVGNTSGAEVAFDNRLVFGKQLSILGSTMGNKKDYQAFLDFYTKHQLKPVIDSEAALSDGIEKLKYLEAGKQFGKIVLKP